jgi:hypothetical protein
MEQTIGGSSTERAMTVHERAFLEEKLRQLPGPIHRWIRGTQNAVMLWAVSTLGLVLLWLAFAWAARKLMQTEIGKTAAIAAWVAGLCGVFAIISSVRWIRSWPDRRPLLEADLTAGRVIEEHFHFVAARRFQEPEHGGLIYFLRTAEGAVMVFFDHESQDLGVQGADPLNSRFEPLRNLVMARSPRAGYVIEKCFSGDALDAGAPAALTLEPSRWPDDEGLCDIPWDELDARLSVPRA